MNIFGGAVFATALMALGSTSAVAEELRYPISIYLTYDGRAAESINKIVNGGSFDVKSIKFPVYVGIAVVGEGGDLNCFEKDEFIARDFREECRDINARNGVIEFVEPQMGVIALRGVSKTNPRFVEAFTNVVLVRHGFHVVRVTYGGAPELSWSPDIE